MKPYPFVQLANSKMSSHKPPSKVVTTARAAFESGRTKPVEFREKQLQALMQMYTDNSKAMCEALNHDLRKSRQESVTLEIEILLNDARNICMNLRRWMRPEKPAKSFVNMLDQLYVFNDPYGVVLIMGAWNYPLLLTLQPVAGAIAAGNCVVIKPSELSSACAKLMAEMIPKYLDAECYQVFLGGIPETTELLKERFDYIFYTGSTTVGKIVHQAAAKHLTPTTLEMGGKTPCYIDKSVNMEVAVRRILWGKCINAGQTCVAPDYLLCTKEVEEKFIQTAKKVLLEFYGPDPKNSPDYCRIINKNHYERIIKYLNDGKIAIGGQKDANERYIAPTILTDIRTTDAVMQEEIFGPILPIISIQNVHDAIKFINAGEKPLALYIFSNTRQDVFALLKNTSSGGVAVNETVMHLGADGLPFGGVGQSGMGAYHGKYSFDTFTHKKGCLYKNLGFLGEKLGSSRYPPYSEGKTRFLNLLLRKRRGVPVKYVFYMLVFVLGSMTAYRLRQLE